MSENKNKMLLVDTTCFQLLDTSTAKLKTERSGFQDQVTKRGLEVTVDVTHGGYINKNNFYYDPIAMSFSVDSFTKPYPKPVLSQHLDEDTPCGRTHSAEYIKLVDIFDDKDLKTPKSKIRVKAIITDQTTIDYILDKRFFTTSVGGNPQKPPKCSICGTPIEAAGAAGIVPGCEHHGGDTYDGEPCYWKIGIVDYNEWSFVNAPADWTKGHVASVVDARWVDVDISVVDSAVDESAVVDSALQDNTKDNGRNIMPEKNDVVADAMEVLDECIDCGDETELKKEWTDAEKTEWTDAETKDAGLLDTEFDSSINLILAEDAKLTPEKRKAMKKETFCGPNRTFPIPDCKHAAVAMAMLNWPRVKSKYSSSARAKIASCVRGKAKTMNCKMSKSKDAVQSVAPLTDDVKSFIATKIAEQLNKKEVAAVKPENTATVPTPVVTPPATDSKSAEEITGLKAKAQELTDLLKKANDEIVSLTSKIREKLAEKIIDLSVMTKRDLVSDILNEASFETREKMYTDHVKKLVERTAESLIDSINDLRKEVKIGPEPSKVDDPLLADGKTVTSDGNKTETKVSKVGEIVFGPVK